MDKVNYTEYLEALEKVRSFHYQLENEATEVGIVLKTADIIPADGGILDFLSKHATPRIVYAVRYFLESEITYAKIPFGSAEKIPVSFFVEQYDLKKLKTIRNLGINSLIILNGVLFNAGYKMLR